MKLSKQQKILLSIAFGVLVFELLFTPIYLIFKSGVTVAIIESIICTSIVGLAIININSFDDFCKLFEGNEDDEEEQKVSKTKIVDDDENEKETDDRFSTINIILTFSCFVFLALIIYIGNTGRLNSKLENEGVIAEATVFDGQHVVRKHIGRRGRTSTIHEYNITFLFKDTLSNKMISAETEISEHAYERMYLNQDVEVIYLPQNPLIFRPLIESRDISRFKHITNRNIRLSDIVDLKGKKDTLSQLNLLNKISQGWRIGRKDGKLVFSNDLKKEMIAFVSEKEVLVNMENIDYLDGNSPFFVGTKLLKQDTLKTVKRDNVISNEVIQFETDSLLVYRVTNLEIENNKTEFSRFIMVTEKEK